MSDSTPDPASILPPEIEAERQAMLLHARTSLSTALGVPLLSQEATDWLARRMLDAWAQVMPHTPIPTTLGLSLESLLPLEDC
jgi:hypothetical protein